MKKIPSQLIKALALAKYYLEQRQRNMPLQRMLLEEINSLEDEEGLPYNWDRPQERL